MGDFDDSLIEEFVEEARELLEESDQSYVSLESNPQNIELINQIFRAAHTIKGTAYTIGVESIGEGAHIYESLLSKIRSGDETTNPEIIDTLLKCNDQLTGAINQLSQDPEYVFDIDLIKNLVDAYYTQKSSKQVSEAGKQTSKIEATAVESKVDAESKSESVNEKESEKSSGLTLEQKRQETLSADAPHVVIVDDDKDVLEVIEEYVVDMEMRTTIFSDPTEALQYIIENKQKINVIITDLKMPDLTGSQMVDKLRDKDINIPVIFISGFAGREEIIKFLDQGAYGFVDKGDTFDKLIILVRNAVRHHAVMSGVKKLAALNFRVYMQLSRVVAELEDVMADVDHMEKAKDILDEVAEVTNQLLYKAS